MANSGVSGRLGGKFGSLGEGSVADLGGFGGRFGGLGTLGGRFGGCGGRFGRFGKAR